jgi:thiosulfate reductase cytochrome b subunit
MHREMVFTRFERFWHWAQALLVILLLVSGFAVHSAHQLMPFGRAADLHLVLAWVLIGLWILAIFWHFTTGEWRQYIPTLSNLLPVMRYYSVGIFDPTVQHPYKKTRRAKHNPLQRLAYLVLKLVISPLIWGSGLLYMFYNDWPAIGLASLDLGTVAIVHTAAAFGMLIFLFAHVYMGFTGKPFTAYFKAMITGYEHVHE